MSDCPYLVEAGRLLTKRTSRTFGRRLTRRYGSAAIIVAMLAPAAAQAQTTPIQTQSTPTQTPAPTTTPPRTFSGSATVGVSVESGRTDLTGVQLQFEGRRPYSASGSFDTSFTYTHATAGPPGGAGPRSTVANRLTATFDVEQNFRTRLVMMLRAQALRDPIAQINYRFAEGAGFGVRLGNTRVQARFLPGVAFLTDDMEMVQDGFRVHFGLYEDITAKIGPAWTFAHFLSLSRGVSDPQDYVINLDAKLTGAITRHLGIQLSYQFNYEKLLPPGVPPDYQKTIAGLQITF